MSRPEPLEGRQEQSVRKAALLERLSAIDDPVVLEDVERLLDEFRAGQLRPLDDGELQALIEELLSGG